MQTILKIVYQIGKKVFLHTLKKYLWTHSTSHRKHLIADYIYRERDIDIDRDRDMDI